jgi:ribosomal-protein-alanine N-acetyltransferase
MSSRTKPLPIQTKRLDLIPMSQFFLVACLAGDVPTAARGLGVPPSPEWLAEEKLMATRLAQLEYDPQLEPWLLRAIVLRSEKAMIGHIGFHSRPGPDYLSDIAPEGVEMGYTIFEPYRRQGYAMEAVAGLMDWAVAAGHVRQFVLTIRPDNRPSQRIAEQFGFQLVGAHMDEVDGLEDIYLREVA